MTHSRKSTRAAIAVTFVFTVPQFAVLKNGETRAGMIDPIVALLYGFAAIFVPAAYVVLLRYTNLA